jgi:hypothetical protein
LLSGYFVIPSPLLATLFVHWHGIGLSSVHQKGKMGKGPEWSPKEREVAALAWFRATNNRIVGADQRGEDYQEEIYAMFKLYSPTKHRAGLYKDHSSKAVFHYLHDTIFPDINKFNDSLLLVIQSSNPTGVHQGAILRQTVLFTMVATRF